MKPIIKLCNTDVGQFVRLLDGCSGNVFLVTSEGDQINLKSKLSQFMGISNLISGGIVAEASISCDDPQDEAKIINFMMYGE